MAKALVKHSATDCQRRQRTEHTVPEALYNFACVDQNGYYTSGPITASQVAQEVSYLQAGLIATDKRYGLLEERVTEIEVAGGHQGLGGSTP